MIEYYNDCLLVDKKYLVLSDLHLGIESNEKGFVNIIKDTIEKLEKIFDLLNKKKIKLRKIIILGDLKSEFGEITEFEWRDVLKFIDFLLSKIISKKENNKKIIVLKGNHDISLQPILRKRNIKLKDHYKINNDIFLHGDKYFEKINECERIFLGHIHPAINIGNKYKKEKYKCFLEGLWKNKKVFVLPSFSNVHFGYSLNDIKDENDFSIIKNKELINFNVKIYDYKENKEYNFGKLKKLI